MKRPNTTGWHELAETQALDALNADALAGLSTQESTNRQARFGANRLTPKKGKHPLLLFLSQFHDPLIYILLVSALITGSLKSWVDASVIFGVVLLNAIIGFIQEFNALRAIDALSRALGISAAVLRDGVRQVVPATELVPGDIVFLQSGDKVAADVRLIKLRDLQIDESALTGESVPVEKNTPSLPPDTVLADRRNMAYSSTLVTYGTGVGMVVETGDRTEIGRINQMIAEATELETPLTHKIRQFSHLLMWFILGLALLTFLAGWLRGQEPIDTFIASVALAVAAIPEGLPVAVTITLAIGVTRMAKRHVIIRKLPAVETLGGTTIICSDKTGTLTQNQMTVQAIYAAGVNYEVTGSGYEPRGEFRANGAPADPQNQGALMECLKAGLLCNDARIVQGAEGWKLEGDPTEGALLVSAYKAGLNPADITKSHPRLDAIPFESAHQFMATLHHNQAADAHHIYLKGSLESILVRCDAALDQEVQRVPLDVQAIHEQVENMAAQGLRVLAFARGERPLGEHTLEHAGVSGGLSFIGLQGMIDPPRQEAIEAIARCWTAGIRVKMITGDHLGTAVAIARQIGLVDPKEPIEALDGKGLAAIADADLPVAAERTAVFARVAPEQKLRLVKVLQARGHIVAMTGDGVNDAPALRQANIGVAMGITGTEVSKEAAAMVLTDDNFASIAAAVEEGRGVYDNLVKFISWTLPTNIGQGLLILIAVLAGVSEGLSFIGLQGMIDPPRQEAIEAIARCWTAGIRVKMITGDHLGTAVAIARQIGLVDPHETIEALDGKGLAAIADADLPVAAERTAVFARVAPEQKLRLVKVLQARGHIVAMTGDGVNDAPALRQANIGVAMGITGTEVSKEAAAMVLTDDNFASIAAAVEEGRGVYDNLVKFISWTLPTNIGQGLLILIAVLAGIELPVLPGQVLWINMTTALFLGLILAFEARERDIMQRPPRDPEQAILTGHLIFRTLLVGLLLTGGAFGLFEWELLHGEGIDKARTAAVNMFVIGQAFYLLNCRSLTQSMFSLGLFSNPWLWPGVLAMLLAQAAFIYLPIMNWLFHSAPIGRDEWLLTLAAGLVIYVIIDMEKLITSRILKRRVKTTATGNVTRHSPSS